MRLERENKCRVRLNQMLALVLLGFGLGRLSNLPSAAAQAADQKQTITLGTATLQLGMAKDLVFSQFGPEYLLNELAKGGGFLIRRKPLTPGGDFDGLGTMFSYWTSVLLQCTPRIASISPRR